MLMEEMDEPTCTGLYDGGVLACVMGMVSW